MLALERSQIDHVVRMALAEDVGSGDVTSLATVPAGRRARGLVIAREAGIMAGGPVVAEVYRQLSAEVEAALAVAEGGRFSAGDSLLALHGPARALLTGERVALNFLQRMCGIATMTARFVALAAGTRARIVDTRKTTPGLRFLEKYSVRAGGGFSHRMGLYDAVMIKDNHIVAAGGIAAAVKAARAAAPHTMTITVECESLVQVEEALAAGAGILLLDNMDHDTRSEAVRRARGKALTEASGGITEATVAETARSGVDVISVGALTHSARALDLSLELTGIEG